MKTRSDRILYGDIPIEKDPAIHPWRAIQITCHVWVQARPGATIDI
jgi:hypothetical protein